MVNNKISLIFEPFAISIDFGIGYKKKRECELKPEFYYNCKLSDKLYFRAIAYPMEYYEFQVTFNNGIFKFKSSYGQNIKQF